MAVAIIGIIALVSIVVVGTFLSDGDGFGGEAVVGTPVDIAAAPMNPFCSDGFLSADEACDDGNLIAGDGCTACLIDEGFSCEGVPSICDLAQGDSNRCGNLNIDLEEECDDNNIDDHDGCSSDCRVEPGYLCSGSPSLCIHTSPSCGDWRLDIGEECDDRWAVDGDGCSSQCRIEPGFTCSGSPSVCRKNGRVVEALSFGSPAPRTDIEPYFPSSLSASSTVSHSFSFSSLSSDHTVLEESQEDAHMDDDALALSDDPQIVSVADIEPVDTVRGRIVPLIVSRRLLYSQSFSSVSSSRPAWVPAATDKLYCGDGLVTGDETCDDGKTVAGDGCDTKCKVEKGFRCSAEPSVCYSVCGNGYRSSLEQCDDGNGVSGDGCSDTCKIEYGYQCRLEPDICTTTCGDFVVMGTEICDDGNRVSGDGCSTTCKVESGFLCSGNPSSCIRP